MSYSVCAYLIEADKVRSVYGACDNQLINQLKVALKQELDSLNDSFSNSLNTDKDAYAVLADIVNGKIRYPEIAFMYGYVYERFATIMERKSTVRKTFGNWIVKVHSSYSIEQ